MNIEVMNYESASQCMELANYMAEHKIGDLLEFFEGDPDMLRLDERIILFVNIKIRQKNHIVYLNVHCEENRRGIEEILSRFHADNFRDHFRQKESLWSKFKDRCIAFRDGKGYAYAIWEYIPDTANSP